MGAVRLPSRRDEAWKWSDLKAAWGADAPVPSVAPEEADKPVIVQLAAALGGLEHVALAPGETAFRVERLDAPGRQAQAVHFEVPDGARLTRLVLQTGADLTLNLGRVRLGAGAQFRQLAVAMGGALARIETYVEVLGEGASVALNGVYLCAAGRHADLTSVVHHKVAGAETAQLIKGAVRAGGRGVFQGKLLVDRMAQKTDAKQHHHALLLDEGAEVYAKPELEIYADDVACAHGNTVGALDEAALFYMRSRGIPLSSARALLIRAFIQEAVADWLPEAERTEVEARLDAWLEVGA